MAGVQRADSGVKNFPAQRNSDFTPCTVSSPASSLHTHTHTHTHTHPSPSPTPRQALNWQEKKAPSQTRQRLQPRHQQSHTENQTQRRSETHSPTRNHPNQTPRHRLSWSTPDRHPQSERASVATNTQILMLTANMRGILCYIYTYIISNPVSGGCYTYFKDGETER